MTAPLEGIRVVEVANWLAGPAAAALMADMGADVVKVEPPGGDALRVSLRQPVGPNVDPGLHYPFELDNRGKRSITVDLDRPGGSVLVLRLCADADVFVTNLPPKRREKYGLTVEAVRAANPRIVDASVSAFGHVGPEADRAGFDNGVYWARSGMMGLFEQVPGAPPPFMRAGQGDHPTSLNLLAAILSALRLRDLTGEGQVVDVSLIATGIWALGSDYSAVLVDHEEPVKRSLTAVPNPLTAAYRTSDARWVMLTMPQADRYWLAFCRAVERPDWAADPGLDSMAKRREREGELLPVLTEIFAAHTAAEWAARLDAAGLIWSPVAALTEVTEDPHVRAMGLFQRVEYENGAYETVGPPFRIANADVRVRGRAPQPGEHTSAILDEAGVPEGEREQLAIDGVFG